MFKIFIFSSITTLILLTGCSKDTSPSGSLLNEINEKKIKQDVGPWWCVHVCTSYNCRLKQIQGSSQLEVVNSKYFFIF